VTDIAIKIEKLTDKNMELRYYSFTSDQLKNLSPLDELKSLETLIKALKIFEETKLYDVTKNGIQIRLARLLAYYNIIGEINADTTTNQ
jgi:hypothetical protein